MITYSKALTLTNAQSNIMKALVRSRKYSAYSNKDNNECEVITRMTSFIHIAKYTMGDDTDKNASIVEQTMNNFLLNRKDVEIYYLIDNNASLYDYIRYKTFILKIKMDLDSLCLFKYNNQKVFIDNIAHKDINRVLFYDTRSCIVDMYNKVIGEYIHNKRETKNKKEIDEINEEISICKSLLKNVSKIKYVKNK